MPTSRNIRREHPLNRLKSLRLLIDGYNVIAPVAPPSRDGVRWLQRERQRLVDRLIQHLDDAVRRRTCVVFDAADPPTDRESEYVQGGLLVKFAVGYREADDLIEEIIACHSAAKNLAVVSSDHRVQAAARRRGATTFESQDWLDRLLDGKVVLAARRRGGARKGTRHGGAGEGTRKAAPQKPIVPGDSDEVEKWMDEFGF